MKKLLLLLILFIFIGCSPKKEVVKTPAPFVWESANLYFLLIDRFNNGNPENDQLIPRTEETGLLRNFMGGDIKGITQKIDEGYFTDLGINAIWMTPVVEQIHGAVNEGTGNTYGYHGYWTKDWTSMDPSFGTREDLKELVEKAHAKGIRIVLDAVINHTGPVTELDPVWPESWVRTEPKCKYDTYQNYIDCTLVENLPDIKTESNEAVELPPMLVEKWKKEGRYEEEIAELDAFFKRTGYPRAPKYYIMKWLADYITDFGIDGYRVDTVKHTTEDIWADFSKVCQETFVQYKKDNPTKVLDDNDFFLVGEVYNYGISGKQIFDFGDKKVNYFENGFNSLINFDFKGDANKPYEEVFSNYSKILKNDFKGLSVMNYVTSHDDGYPFDKNREKSIVAGTKLLLTPGIAQVYYGDESARPLDIKGTEGDATLRSFMNWDDIKSNEKTKKVLSHYQKIGQFRATHPAIGAGIHQEISKAPFYTFSRTFTKGEYTDQVIVGLDLPIGKKTINVKSVFEEGEELIDTYSDSKVTVKAGEVIIDSPFDIVLLERR
jgi:alpha-amylase